MLVRSVPNKADGSFDLEYLETLLHGVEGRVASELSVADMNQYKPPERRSFPKC